jgi:hypothetical protein
MLNSFDLHDSSVMGVNYNKEERKLIIKLELCNWKQPLYIEGENELVHGSLEFYNVPFYRIEPIDALINGNEILLAEVYPQAGKSEKCKFVLTGNTDVFIIYLESDDVKWIKYF